VRILRVVKFVKGEAVKSIRILFLKKIEKVIKKRGGIILELECYKERPQHWANPHGFAVIFAISYSNL